MGVSIQDLKETKQKLQDAFNLSAADSARVVGYINTNNADIIQDILSGDFSGVPSVLSALGISASGSKKQTAEKTTKKARRESDPIKNNLGTAEKKTVKQSAARGLIQGDIIKDNTSDIIQPSAALSGSLGAFDSLSDKIPADGLKDHINENKAVSIIDNFDTRKENNTDIIQSADADIIPAVDGEIITPSSVPGLPDGFGDVVEGWLADWSIKYKIDLVKASGQQWRSACIYVGSNIQRSGVLIDRDKMKRGGSKYYSPEAALALLYLWEYITGLYRHIPLVSDFIAFTGASREWFYDTHGKGLSSSRVDLLKKARAIEEAGISAGIIDGRENPTGRIYYSKAGLGWQETAPAVAAPVAVVVAVGDLPALTKNVDK